MGAILKPSTTMTPWWDVEVRRESAYLAASVYVPATLSRERTTTAEERAGAWCAIGAWDTLAPGPRSALLAALDQVLTHPRYREWRAAGGAPLPDSITATLTDDRVLIHAPLIRYDDELDGGHFAHAELGYEYTAPLRAAVAALT
ncbi:hypothetical protein [Streptomyces fuscigenes]|uniref:hypothetical protein n=1 Tax=Streptomyces fuscigenes TaxID=1528880 RepID=UPI001F1E6F64|nr:hypothetical protein [Streptomyces fuscigenes]MCF3960285.1 hypothetical protein [Streptomyces fuscigenes]